MAGAVELGMYRVGATGATITWRDGAVRTYPPFTRVTIRRAPLRVQGKLLRLGPRGVTFEAPQMRAAE